MGQPPSAPPVGPRRRRKINVDAIKAVIVTVVGWLTGFVSALTGLGPQAAFAPMLSWMLGFSAEKAQAAAVRFALFSAAAGAVGAVAGHSIPAQFALRGMVLFVGATAGAMLAAPLAAQAMVMRRRAVFQSLGIALMVFVLIQTAHLTEFNRPQLAQWNGPFALLGMGIVVGALTQGMGLPGGMLLVPTLWYAGGFAAQEAVALSLLVIAVASVLPTWSYGKRGLLDARFSAVSLAGGTLGGLAGGWLLHRMPQHLTLALLAAVAMFLCARELARLHMQSPPAGRA